MPRREICASGSAKAARAVFGAPVVVKKPLCQPGSVGSSLTRNQISMVVPGCCQTRSALWPMNSACLVQGMPLAASGGFVS